MPYTPPLVIPSVPIPGVLAGTTSGTITTFDYSLHLNALIVELNKLNFTLSSAGGLEPGSPVAIMKGQAQVELQNAANLDLLLDKLSTMIVTMGTLNQSIQNSIEMNASVAFTLNTMVTTQQLAVADQIKNNHFQQLTTNAALVDAGKPPTEVKPESLTAQITGAVNDIGTIKTQVGATTLITQGLTSMATSAATMATTLWAKSSLGTWFATQWASIKGTKAVSYPLDVPKAVADKTERTVIATQIAAVPPAADAITVVSA